MDTLTLAATSFTIALSLLITGKKDMLQNSFAGLCAAVFVAQTGVFMQSIFARQFWLYIEYLGFFAIAPLALWFFRYLTHNKSLLTRSSIVLLTFIGMLEVFLLFTPFVHWTYFHGAVLAYVYCMLGFCYIGLFHYVEKMPPSTEKRRLRYLLIACPTAFGLCSLDLLGLLGFAFPTFSRLIISALLY